MVTTVASTLRAFLLPYARYFAEKGWTVDALANGSGVIARGVFNHCYEASFSRNPLNFRNLKGTGKMIRDLVTEKGYDVVHVHTPVAAFVTRLALRRLSPPRPKVVYTAHGFHFYKGGSYSRNTVIAALERLAGDWTDHTITINKEDYEAALTLKIAPKERLSLLPGIGLDLERYSPAAVKDEAVEGFRADLNLKKEDELFLMVGEFIPRKRHEDALRALAGTGRRDFYLAFAGAGPLEDDMKVLAKRLGVESRAHFLGERDDVPLLMLASRAVVLPSSQEGLSRAVMEAICLGVPVLGANVRGIRELLTTPERGALVPVGKPAALAAAMLLSVDAPHAAQPSPDPRWDIRGLLTEHEKIYSRLLWERNQESA
jgi:glycosyltransferase involved in cell wall biosynthesis